MKNKEEKMKNKEEKMKNKEEKMKNKEEQKIWNDFICWLQLWLQTIRHQMRKTMDTVQTMKQE